jgi:GTP:adenosylcobinamide-phosphate guanylyltransferase
MIDAVVLAGGKNSDAMRAATGVENRAMVRLGDETMLDYVLSALRSSDNIEKVIVVGEVPEPEGCCVVSPGATLVDNLFRGLAHANQTRPVLTVTSDIPFLTPAAVNDFVHQALATKADFCYPIIPLFLCKQQYPQMQRTSLKVKEGTFTGGNLILLNPRTLADQHGTILSAYASRKSPLKLGQMVGLGLTMRLLLSQTFSPRLISVPDLEAGVSALLGCRAAAVITHYPEIGTDIDKPEDVKIAQEMLSAKGECLIKQW